MKANTHVLMLKNAITQEGFVDIDFVVSDSGRIIVRGNVQDKIEYYCLKDMIKKMNLPVKINYEVMLNGEYICED